MMSQFIGTIEELKMHVQACGYVGEWKDKRESKRHFLHLPARTGEILNWWPANGTLSFQGKNADVFNGTLSSAISGNGGIPNAKPADVSQRILIVHGHDSEARDQLELVLRRLGLEPFILQNSDGRGENNH